MSVYAGRYAELYDLFYSDKPYAEEAKFVHECIQELSSFQVRHVLELACGTGRHALELEKYGYNVIATDRSREMLQIAQQRATKNNSKVEFVAADMEQLGLTRKEFDAAVCLFDSIGYLKTNESLVAALKGIWDHLRANGLFIFEFWHAPAMLNQYSPGRIRRWNNPKSEIIRISETTLDRKNRLARVDYTVHELNDDGTYSTFRETHLNRFFSVGEMEAILAIANFKPVRFFAGFKQREQISEDTWHVVAVARKVSSFDSVQP
jgi:SAM-dependent methyltransferase